jgi:dTMP kinase
MLPGLCPGRRRAVDRWNRKAVMVTCDIGRAALLALLPFWSNVLGLVVISFSIEVFTLLWGPAKDATVPNLVKDPDQLATANSLELFAAIGTFPLGTLIFALLAAVSSWLANFSQLAPLHPHQASLAIWVDGFTFTSAVLISGLVIPSGNGEAKGGERSDAPARPGDIVDGLRFIRANSLVRRRDDGLGAAVAAAPSFRSVQFREGGARRRSRRSVLTTPFAWAPRSVS